jgi:hypothetical protein
LKKISSKGIVPRWDASCHGGRIKKEQINSSQCALMAQIVPQYKYPMHRATMARNLKSKKLNKKSISSP